MKIYVCLLALIFLIIIACQPQTNHQNNQASTGEKYAKLSVEQFNVKLKATPNSQLIDVRTPEEFSNGFIEGAENLNFYDDNFETLLSKLDKNKPVMVYCQSGGRSGKCFNKLKKMGFSEVYDLQGGFKEWSKKDE